MNKSIKKITTLLVGIFSLTLVLTACGSKAKQNNNTPYASELVSPNKLTIGLNGEFPPYGYRSDNGKLTGYEVDLSKAIAKKLNLQADFRPTKWDSLVAGLGSGRFDVILNDMVKTPERAKAFNFSTPYMYEKYNLITNANNNSIKGLSDIKGKKMAQGTGSDHELIAEKFGGQIVPTAQTSVITDLIKQNRVDGSIDSLEGWNNYKKNQSTKGLQSHEIPSNIQKPASVSAMFNKQTPQLRKSIDQAIKDLQKDGTTKKLSYKYFGRDVTTDK